MPSGHHLANRGQVDKRSLLEHLSSVLLSLDEVVDGGCVLLLQHLSVLRGVLVEKFDVVGILVGLVWQCAAMQ